MNCLVNKETLNDFYNNFILFSYRNLQPELFQRCVQRCEEIVSAYKRAFSDECAQLDLLLCTSKDTINWTFRGRTRQQDLKTML